RLDDGAERPVVAVHQGAGRLRVEAFVERRRPDEVGEDDRDDLACTGVLRGAGDERGAAGVAELRVGGAVRAALGTARCQRPATATGEPSLRRVRFPTLVTVHGDTPSTPGRLRWFTFRASDTTRRARGPSLRTIGNGPFAASSSTKKHTATRTCSS